MDGKLAQLIESEGYYASQDNILAAVTSDSVAPGSCVREGMFLHLRRRAGLGHRLVRGVRPAKRPLRANADELLANQVHQLLVEAPGITTHVSPIRPPPNVEEAQG
jgi:hypothetical protein